MAPNSWDSQIYEAVMGSVCGHDRRNSYRILAWVLLENVLGRSIMRRRITGTRIV
jgi:hypothetical protein